MTKQHKHSPDKPREKEGAGFPRLYIGPTIAKLGLIQNVIYTDFPREVKDAIGLGHTFFVMLFIAPADFASAEKQIANHTGYAWDAYKKALQFL